MTNVDFGIAFFLLILIIVYSVMFISSNITNDFNHFNSEKLENEASAMMSGLFFTEDHKSLVSEFKEIQVRFSEISATSHLSNLEIEITPEVSKAHVYDKRYNEIASSVTSISGKTIVSFDMGFSPLEKKYVYIVYEGSNTSNINYTSNSSENNVTSVIISENEIYLLSQSKCSYLQSMSYEESRNFFGFTENFRISNGCIYGPEPPEANVIVRTISMLVEQADETIQSEKVNIMVW